MMATQTTNILSPKPKITLACSQFRVFFFHRFSLRSVRRRVLLYYIIRATILVLLRSSIYSTRMRHGATWYFILSALECKCPSEINSFFYRWTIHQDHQNVQTPKLKFFTQRRSKSWDTTEQLSVWVAASRPPSESTSPPTWTSSIASRFWRPSTPTTAPRPARSARICWWNSRASRSRRPLRKSRRKSMKIHHK